MERKEINSNKKRITTYCK